MQLARVIGTVVATRQYRDLRGIKFLIVQPLTKEQQPTGKPVVAADATFQAGPGELVFVVGSPRSGPGDARTIRARSIMPLWGIVDDVNLAG